MSQDLAPHPRLYANAEQIDRLRRPPRVRWLRALNRRLETDAGTYAACAEAKFPHHHNAHLLRARAMQTHIVTLLMRWAQTGDRRFRDAAVRKVRAIGDWEYWSWITWRKNDPNPLAIFDLSYGENSATLALAYDWLHDTLDPAEHDLFVHIAQKRSLDSFCRHIGLDGSGHPIAHWVDREDYNWNAVCAGGAGMLVLAMHEHVPQAERIIARIDRSLAHYMKTLQRTDGAWPEGIGYWNYGMRYAFMYLLSHENATGQPHPLLRQPTTAQTLRFPIDFCPNGVPCSFGDANSWRPLPIHYAAAERLGCDDVLAALDEHAGRQGLTGGDWPVAEFLLLHPWRRAVHSEPARDVRRFYHGQDWGMLADQWPRPRLCVTVRGGTTDVPHSHRDLLSFHCVVRDEAMIVNTGPAEYLDTTFSPRRDELFEMTPGSKNTILINGVGIAPVSSVRTEMVEYHQAHGFRIDATEAMHVDDGSSAVEFCGRVVLMLADHAILILDRVQTVHPARVETRLHTFAQIQLNATRAQLRGQRQRLTVTCACDVPATLEQAIGPSTTPGHSANILRWCIRDLHTRITTATLLSSGISSAKITLAERRGHIHVSAAGKRWRWQARIRADLTCPTRGRRRGRTSASNSFQESQLAD